MSIRRRRGSWAWGPPRGRSAPPAPTNLATLMLHDFVLKSSMVTAAARPRGAGENVHLTVDQLARLAGTTTRNVRALQTLGLVPPPELHGRTGLYGREHLDRLRAVLRLQRSGFTLGAVGALFEASARGLTLEQLIGVPAAPGR